MSTAEDFEELFAPRVEEEPASQEEEEEEEVEDPSEWPPIIDCAYIGEGVVICEPEVAAAQARRRAVVCAIMGWDKTLRDLYHEVGTCTEHCYKNIDPQPQVRSALFEEPEPADDLGRTVTYIAAKAGHLGCLEFLLEFFSPSTECPKGTPLHGACKKGHLDCVKLLLSHFPNVDQTDANGDTPLHVAESRGFTECAAAIETHIQFCNSVPPITRWVTWPDSSPCNQVQSIACERAAIYKSSIAQGVEYNRGRETIGDEESEECQRFLCVWDTVHTFRCLGAMPYAITTYICAYQGHVPRLIPKFPQILPALSQPVGPTAVGIMSLPPDVLVNIFTLCRRSCPCAFHSKEVTGMPILRYTEAMYTYGSSCYRELPSIPWNLYECAYTLCTLELVCKAFHVAHEPASLSLPEQAAKEMCLQFGITDLKEGKSWKEQLMLRDIVGREFALHSNPEASKAVFLNTCFTGDGEVSFQNGKGKVATIRAGDKVLTEDGTYRTIKRVHKEEAFTKCNVVVLQGVVLTPGHPVLSNGEWMHPFEIAPVTRKYVTHWYNFELEGGPKVTNHSVVINGLVVCTLGKDCGTRITTGWPKQDKLFGRGYWTNNPCATIIP
ncbi:hypothetical protein Pelo_14272 [Pelomyxa schiedti]|nr:hypothetical protein Pelo_14272 [Pelomyxa schiedti]